MGGPHGTSAMLDSRDGRSDMTLRELALAVAVVLAVPAAIALLRPGRAGDDPGELSAARRLDAFWAAVPLVLLVVLIALAVAA